MCSSVGIDMKVYGEKVTGSIARLLFPLSPAVVVFRGGQAKRFHGAGWKKLRFPIRARKIQTGPRDPSGG